MYMKICSGIGFTDGVNKYGHKFSVESMINAYNDSWNIGMPSHINHDRTKIIGWTYPGALYFEPGLTSQTIEIHIPINKKEEEKMITKANDYFENHKLKQINEYEFLYEKVKDFLSDNYKYSDILNCVAIDDEGIVKKIFPNLIKESKDNLVDINELETIMPGVYKKNEFIVFAHKYLRRSLSRKNTINTPFLERLESLRGKNLSVKVALDIDTIGLIGTESTELEYQYWWGPKFDDDLSDIKYGVTRHENSDYEKMFNSINFTDFGWYEQDNKKTFECEEVIDIPNIKINDEEYYGCRFVHSMLDEFGFPIHLDGAIRAYDLEQMVDRIGIPINKTERNTVYTKLWRIDNKMEVETWKDIISNYYRDNMLIGEYFGGEDNNISEREITELKNKDLYYDVDIKDFIPIDSNPGDGIKITSKFSDGDIKFGEYDILPRTDSVILLNNKAYKYIEADSISLFKLLEKENLKLRRPYVKMIDFNDMIYNFPKLTCKNIDVANNVINALSKLCDCWIEKKDDRIISFSIQVPYGDISIIFSFAGHIDDFKIWFNKCKKKIPNSLEAFGQWGEYNSEFMKYHYKKDNSDIFDLMNSNGRLIFERSFIKPQQIESIKVDKNNATSMATFKLSAAEKNLIKKNNIVFTYVYDIKSESCSKCGKNYYTCDCIKYIDDAGTRVDKCEFIGRIWTTRSAFK